MSSRPRMKARRSHSPLRIWSHSSLRCFDQPPEPAKSEQKGPAFWSSSVVGRLVKKKTNVSPVKKKKCSPCFSASKLHGITKWAPFLAVFLAAVALSLFSVLMSCLNIYIKKADTLNDQTLHMRMREKRLNDAIKLLAGDQDPPLCLGQQCKICGNYTWLQRGENCYRLTDLLMPWGRCVGRCQKRAGGLLKAETQGEMEFLLQESRKWVRVIDRVHVPQKIWIGLLFNLSQTTWCWADGEILHMQISIHVSAPCPGECCVAIHNGKAITNPCSEENRCLCKKVVL